MSSKTRTDRILAAISEELRQELEIASCGTVLTTVDALALARQIVGTYMGAYGKARDVK
jgi:hypothetical protein